MADGGHSDTGGRSALSRTVEFDAFHHRLGRRLKLLRVACGLTQRDVAAYMGVSRVAVGYIEQGRRIPSLPILHRLAELYGMTVSELCDVDGELAVI